MNTLRLYDINIENYIFEVRGKQVMLANDLAKLYSVETRYINQIVKRNIKRFPDDFCFQLTKDEYDIIFLRSQNVTSNIGRGGVRYLPFVFTSEGIRLISTILRNKNVAQITAEIIDTFERKNKQQILSKSLVNSSENIRNMIFEIRGKQVLLDSDVARLFDYSTKDLNRNVKNNFERFPENYCFQLTLEEYNSLRCKFFTLNDNGRGQHKKYLPYVFTEYGITMLAGLLKSNVAIQASINIVNTFIEMRKLLGNRNFEARLLNVEQKIIDMDVKNELKFQECNNKFDILFSKFKEPENTHLFYDGKIYDAYSLLLDILNEAKSNIIIIDNYIDKSLLDVISKLKIKVNIITSHIDKELINKYKKQYNNINITINKCYHDRFIIIDQKILYHSGASFKDLGHKCFAINKIDNDDILKQLLNKINI